VVSFFGDRFFCLFILGCRLGVGGLFVVVCCCCLVFNLVVGVGSFGVLGFLFFVVILLVGLFM